MQDAKVEVQRRLAEVKAFLAGEPPHRLSESDTKANFIEPIIAALGWRGIGVVTREYYVRNSQEFIDYVMKGPDGLLLAIEAKPLHTQLTDKHAAQLIQYCAVEGIEWAALTNGRELQFFNSFLKPDLAAKRVLHIDLLDFRSDDEFDAIFGQLWQLSRERMTTPNGVRAWLNQRRLDAALRAIVSDPASPVVRQLRTALTNVEIRATTQDVAQWFRSQLRPSGDTEVPPRPPGNAGTGKAMSAGPSKGGAVGVAGQSLLLSLKHAVDQRLPATVWHTRKHYTAAEVDGETYIAVRERSQRLIVGLALPADADGPLLQNNASQFNWPRITKVAYITSDSDVTTILLDQIVAAQAHAANHLRTKTYHGITLRNLLDAGYLKPETELILVGPSNREVARARLQSSGEIEWEGHNYRSPSDKAFAKLLARQSLNGWAHWRTGLHEGSEFLADIRARMQSASKELAPES